MFEEEDSPQQVGSGTPCYRSSRSVKNSLANLKQIDEHEEEEEQESRTSEKSSESGEEEPRIPKEPMARVSTKKVSSKEQPRVEVADLIGRRGGRQDSKKNLFTAQSMHEEKLQEELLDKLRGEVKEDIVAQKELLKKDVLAQINL